MKKLTFPVLFFLMLNLPLRGEETKISFNEESKRVVLETDSQKIVFDCADTARIVSWQFNGTDYVTDALTEKGGHIAKDGLWSPGRRLFNLAEPYVLTGKETADRKIILRFQGKIDASSTVFSALDGGGWKIEKTYVIKQDVPELTVIHTIVNQGRNSRYFSFWFHNWLETGSNYLLLLQGYDGTINYDPAVSEKKCENVVFPVKDAPFTRGNEKFEADYRLSEIMGGTFLLYSRERKIAFVVSTDCQKLLQEYSYVSSAVKPTVEFMTRPVTLKPDETWELKTVIKFVPGAGESDLKGILESYPCK